MYIYVIAAGGNRVKIGVASNAATRRSDLQTGCPFRLTIFEMFKVPNRKVAFQCESKIHKALGRVALEGEWFRIDPAKAAAVARSVIHGPPRTKDLRDSSMAAMFALGWNEIVCPHCKHRGRVKMLQRDIRQKTFRCQKCERAIPGTHLKVAA